MNRYLDTKSCSQTPDLEFIRMTHLLGGRAKSQSPRRQVKKDRRHSLKQMLPINIPCFFVGKRIYRYEFVITRETYHPKGCYVENVFGRQRRNLALQPAAVEWGVRIHSNVQNEPNFPYFSTKNEDLTKKRTQYEPNRTQFWTIIKGVKPIRTQSKPNFSSIMRGTNPNEPNCSF